MDRILALHQQMDSCQTVVEVEAVAIAIKALYSEMHKRKSAWRATYVPPKKVRRLVTKTDLCKALPCATASL